MSDRMGFIFDAAKDYGTVVMQKHNGDCFTLTIGGVLYTGTEAEIRRQLAEEQAKATLAKSEGLNVAERAGLCTCGLPAEEGQSA